MSAHPIRRRRVLAGGLASLLLVGGGAVVAFRGDDNNAANASDGDGDESDAAGASTAQVTLKDLEEREELAGTLGYGETTDVSLSANGTITALPALGTIVDRGQTVAEVDGLPVTLWFGDRPFWRALGADVDDGPDIAEVEANLVALGYATSDSLTVDNEWTSATTTALKKWQKDQGKEQTGTFNPGDVVVQPGAIRIAELPSAVGAPANGVLAKATGATRQVTMDLDATKQSLVSLGQAVEVELPDGTILQGTIASIGTVATSSSTDPVTGKPTDPTIEVTLSLADPSLAGTLDAAPVTVRVVTSAATGVLAVPVDALLALSEGGYAIERVKSNGTTELVTVETGAFADGWVQVTGDVAEGDTVVVPK
jgi:hypothetical protein